MSKRRERPKTKGTTFTCHAPEAEAVFLAGTFNNWDTKAMPMAKGADGNWTAALELSPGRYEFKFIVDGAWCCEPGRDGADAECPNCVPNPFGTMNRMIEVTGR